VVLDSCHLFENRKLGEVRQVYVLTFRNHTFSALLMWITIYDTIEEFNVDSKPEYSA